MTRHLERTCFQRVPESRGRLSLKVQTLSSRGAGGARPGAGSPGRGESAAGQPPPGGPGGKDHSPAATPSRELPATPPHAAAERTCGSCAPETSHPPNSDLETATSAAPPRPARPPPRPLPAPSRRTAARRLTPGLASQEPGAPGALSAAARLPASRDAWATTESQRSQPASISRFAGPGGVAGGPASGCGACSGHCGRAARRAAGRPRAGLSAQPPGIGPRPACCGTDGGDARQRVF